jgi:hypothetical protein
MATAVASGERADEASRNAQPITIATRGSTPDFCYNSRMGTARTGCRWSVLLAVCVAAWITGEWNLALAKEARPPKWSRDVLDTFFEDAREALEGERPDYSVADGASGTEAAAQEAATPSDQVAWSQLISADALETEIKRAAKALDGSVTTPSAFKGGGFRNARRELSELAVLFAVAAQWNGEVRWKNSAAGLRDVFARSAANAKVGSDPTFREAEVRKQELADLIRGARPQVPKAAAAVEDWSKVAARPPLMQRLNIAHQERLLRRLADEKVYEKSRDEIRHEAQVVALLASVIHRPSYEFSDDETFAGYAIELQQAANDVAAAAESNNFEQARDALNRATNACANCHDGYRG